MIWGGDVKKLQKDKETFFAMERKEQGFQPGARREVQVWKIGAVEKSKSKVTRTKRISFTPLLRKPIPQNI